MAGLAWAARVAVVCCAGMTAWATVGCASTRSRTVWLKHAGGPELPRASERDVAVYLSPALLEFSPTAKEGIEDWRFPNMGRTVARWFVSDLRKRFSNVGRIDALPSVASGRDDFPLVIDLRIEDVRWSMSGVFRRPAQATVRLWLTVYDSHGAKLIAREVEGAATVVPVMSRNRAENVARLVSAAASKATRNAAAIVEKLHVPDAAPLPKKLPINDWKDLKSTAPSDAAGLVADSSLSDGSLDLGWAMVNQSGSGPRVAATLSSGSERCKEAYRDPTAACCSRWASRTTTTTTRQR